ncbi:MAG: hypothetical protein K2G12_10650 [Prevotella sp.]|nr:hypothetical protein [Prevotella sp.]
MRRPILLSSIAGFCLCATAQTGKPKKDRERKRMAEITLSVSVSNVQTSEMDVGIAANSVYERPSKACDTKKIATGDNKPAVPALLSQGNLAGIVTVSHKDERHSKTITVSSHE